jgi:hypothetical protein
MYQIINRIEGEKLYKVIIEKVKVRRIIEPKLDKNGNEIIKSNGVRVTTTRTIEDVLETVIEEFRSKYNMQSRIDNINFNNDEMFYDSKLRNNVIRRARMG